MGGAHQLFYAERDLILHAEHLGFAGDAAAPRAYHGAAQDQFTRFRLERALQLVRVGLKIASAPDSFELKCLEGELLRILGSAPGSITAFRSAYEVATDDLQRCHALVGVADGLGATEEHEELIKVLLEAETIAKDHSLVREMARILQLRAGVLFFRGDNAACLKANNAALQYARDSNSFEMVARALSSVGDAEYNRGRFNSAFHYFDQ